jgi:hypothetical protein
LITAEGSAALQDERDFLVVGQDRPTTSSIPQRNGGGMWHARHPLRTGNMDLQSGRPGEKLSKPINTREIVGRGD